MNPTCVSCGKPLEAPYLRLQFVGLPGSRLTGAAFLACADHVRLVFPEDGPELPERISDPEMELVAPEAVA